MVLHRNNFGVVEHHCRGSATSGFSVSSAPLNWGLVEHGMCRQHQFRCLNNSNLAQADANAGVNRALKYRCSKVLEVVAAQYPLF